jgi:antitoxin (DNA-binding transcriptional repressor) of toxin-antitoxin stability system
VEKASISQLKNNLSAYIKKVRAGASVTIFDRDRPVARLERVRPDEFAGEHLTELERQGLIKRPSRPLTAEEFKAFLEEPLPKADASVLEALIEERREGR